MLKRKVEQDLLMWKEKENKNCLLVGGARQVGKTYIIDNFARENYENYVLINFDENEGYKSIFEDSLEVDVLISNISFSVPNVKLVPRKTLIFLDEIQNCPRAITALKFFSIDKRFDVIASGSLLGINYKEVPSYPVGYVEHLEMSSLDFEEFCWANGVSDESIKDLKKYFDTKKQVPTAIHEKMLDLFKRYIVVGGMPQAVLEYVSSHNYQNVLKIQRDILNGYGSDIQKYAEGIEKNKARACFFSIPQQLAKANKKFQYSLVEKGGSARKYAGSLMWLFDAGIVNFCYNLSTPELPLEGNVKNDVFKVYMRDTGLFVAMLEDGAAKDILNGNLGIYKGAIYENIIADIFTKSGKKLYYFEYNSQLEIDFFIRYLDKVTAVEVKSAENTRAKSLRSVMQNWGVKQGIKLSTKNIGERDGVINYPLYMAMFL